MARWGPGKLGGGRRGIHLGIRACVCCPGRVLGGIPSCSPFVRVRLSRDWSVTAVSVLLRSLGPGASCVGHTARPCNLNRGSRLSQRHKLVFTLGDSDVGEITRTEQPRQWQASGSRLHPEPAGSPGQLRRRGVRAAPLPWQQHPPLFFLFHSLD